MSLSGDELDRYRRDGFLVLRGFVAAERCDALRARMAELMAGFDPAGVRTVIHFLQRKNESSKLFF